MIVLTLVAALAAATPITLEEVRAASRQATTAQLAELERQRAEAQVTVNRSRLLPQVGLVAQGGFSARGRSERLNVRPNPDGTFTEEVVSVPANAYPWIGMSLGVDQSVFDPALWANLGVAQAQEEAAEARAAEERLAAELEGIRRFYELLRAQKTLQVIAARVKASDELALRAEALFEAGRRRKEDAISARINAVNDRTAFVRQQAIISLASANLSAWVGRGADDTLVAVEPGVMTEQGFAVPTYEDALSTAREQRPQLRAMDALMRAAERAVSSARAAYLPTVALGARYSRNAYTDLSPFLNPQLQHGFDGQVTVRWDLFNGFITNAQVGQARIEEQRALLNLEQVRRDVQADLRARVEQLRTALEVTQISEENLALASDNLALAQARFEEGAGSTLEIRDAQVKHTAAELQLLESRIDTELARAGLERAIGAFSPGVAQ